MKLQHTSGAVIEDARIEERGDFFYTVCGVTRGCIYSKADWRRVPEGRWERVAVEVEGVWLRFSSSPDGYEGKYVLPLKRPPEGYRYTTKDGNLCVERRVEGT